MNIQNEPRYALAAKGYIYDKVYSNRVEFALFIKVLLRHLQRTRQYTLLQQCRLVIITCTRRMRMGDPDFIPISEAIERRLFDIVGKGNWKKAQAYTRYYIKREKEIKELGAPALSTSLLPPPTMIAEI